MRKTTTMLAALLALVNAAAVAQSLEVKPGREVLEGEPVSLELSQFKPGSEVRLKALRVVRNAYMGAQVFRAEAVFLVDAVGRIDPTIQAPRSGSYTGADSRGLFWSMKPAKVEEALAKQLRDAPNGEVLIQASSVAADGAETLLAEQRLLLRPVAEGLQRRAVEGMPGAQLVLPAPSQGGSKLPVVIVLGGSEGGTGYAASIAAELASRGFATLALPYYSPGRWGAAGPLPPELPELPRNFAMIELARLEQARDWLATQAEVDARRIAVYGVSKGAEFALSAAARMPWLKGVVAVVPSDVVWEGWDSGRSAALNQPSFAWKGQALPFVPYQDFQQEFSGFMTGSPVIVRRPQDKGRAAHPQRAAEARIPVELYPGPMLLVAGTDDEMWDSGGMARAIAAKRAERGLVTEALVYEGAGHAIQGSGYQPTTMHNAGPMKMGGTPEADARAQGDAWPRMLAFLKRTLAL
ncbi:acyl-CoA thioesterase/bile acid-CoA:amino acid N-acyltransferase family protein [Pelomonas sp. SE-A7]|uniref:acyl-CoA thioesterase/bile acid-CoA:amino acid N-acyltransferase family protein n=1 Tax=Pelomonas sp. SE-A7 TaxID=3054953 RepID=UPI00259CAC61|nr:acyl-CoA thioesterase/bile acid-CoA:amino acid N-acyltransferase family protein [Pelomonas sp. SE-A7]MDM4767855.1 acyl-CoA thioesterase/bile acid-CoA:amino acid N-acyltransferase family protein [Pelomonas sp. SE-A7]